MKSIAVPATEDSLDEVISFVEEELEEFECSPRTLYQIEVLIEEVFVNIVSYAGLGDDECAEIRCGVLEDPRRLVLQFLDAGVAFDPLAAEDPDISPEGLMGREGGLGIYMVKQMMDDVSYAREDGKNVLTIQKNLP